MADENVMEVEFIGKKFKIKRMSLSQYAKFAKKLDKMMPNARDMEALDEGDTVDKIQTMAALFRDMPGKFAELISVATGIAERHILKASAPEVFDLAHKIYEYNQIDELSGKILNAISFNKK